MENSSTFNQSQEADCRATLVIGWTNMQFRYLLKYFFPFGFLIWILRYNLSFLSKLRPSKPDHTFKKLYCLSIHYLGWPQKMAGSGQNRDLVTLLLGSGKVSGSVKFSQPILGYAVNEKTYSSLPRRAWTSLRRFLIFSSTLLNSLISWAYGPPKNKLYFLSNHNLLPLDYFKAFQKHEIPIFKLQPF